MLRGWGRYLSFSGGLCVCVVAAAVFLGNNSACLGDSQVTNLNPGQSIGLSLLLSNNVSSVQIGDKVFGEFSVVSGNTNLFTGDDLELTALSNLFGFGISFTGAMTAIGNITEDAVVRFSVTVTNSSQLISDVHLDYDGLVFGAGFSSVTEDVFTGGFGGVLIKQIDVYDLLGGSNQQLTASADLPTPMQKIYIQKDIIFGGGAAGGQNMALISIIDQTFSQIPEPSTMLLSFAGFATLMFLKRRK